MKHGLVRKHTVTKGILTPVRLYSKSCVDLSYKKFSAKKRIFQNFETNINFALLEYHCLHLIFAWQQRIYTANVRRNENSLSKSKSLQEDNTSIKSPINKGHDMSPSSTPGAVQSRVQQIFQSSINLGQSSQGFNRSFKVQLTWGSPVNISTKSINYRLTWGKYPSPSLGAFECQECSTIPSSPAGNCNHQQNNGQLKLPISDPQQNQDLEIVLDVTLIWWHSITYSRFPSRDSSRCDPEMATFYNSFRFPSRNSSDVTLIWRHSVTYSRFHSKDSSDVTQDLATFRYLFKISF